VRFEREGGNGHDSDMCGVVEDASTI